MEERAEQVKEFFKYVSELGFEIKALEMELADLNRLEVWSFLSPLIEECEQRIDKLKSQRLEAVRLIAKIESSEYRKLLTLRYIENMADDEIMKKLYIAPTSFFRWLKNAFNELAELPDCPVLHFSGVDGEIRHAPR